MRKSTTNKQYVATTKQVKNENADCTRMLNTRARMYITKLYMYLRSSESSSNLNCLTGYKQATIGIHWQQQQTRVHTCKNEQAHNNSDINVWALAKLTLICTKSPINTYRPMHRHQGKRKELYWICTGGTKEKTSFVCSVAAYQRRQINGMQPIVCLIQRWFEWKSTVLYSWCPVDSCCCCQFDFVNCCWHHSLLSYVAPPQCQSRRVSSSWI